jgi:hypothetical protein
VPAAVGEVHDVLSGILALDGIFDLGLSAVLDTF